MLLQATRICLACCVPGMGCSSPVLQSWLLTALCAIVARVPLRQLTAHALMQTQGGSPHLFTALITTDSSAQGGNYLRRNMHRELLKQASSFGTICSRVSAWHPHHISAWAHCAPSCRGAN